MRLVINQRSSFERQMGVGKAKAESRNPSITNS
jgi:hypothetical protein